MAVDIPRPKDAPPKAWRPPPVRTCRSCFAVMLATQRVCNECGRGSTWADIPPAQRFGLKIEADDVQHIPAGALLRFYSPDAWFEPGPRAPRLGEIVRFTGKVDLTFPKVGPHLEVADLDGSVYPGGGWVHRLFQFVAEA